MISPYHPRGQSMQLVAFSRGWKVFAPHAVHRVSPSVGANIPGKQESQEILPDRGCTKPAEHFTQAVLALLLASLRNLPALHCMQFFPGSFPAQPMGQARHSCNPCIPWVDFPAAHEGKHTPARFANVFTAQCQHAFAPLEETLLLLW